MIDMPSATSQWPEKVRASFGLSQDTPIDFSEMSFSLRFELGGEIYGMNQPIRRFLRAFERASKIVDAVFGASSSVVVIVRCWGDINRPETDLSRLKLVLPDIESGTFERVDETGGDGEFEIFDEFVHEYWHVTEVSDLEQIREFLWLDIAREMGVKPSTDEHDFWLMDLERAIFLNVYDDRGLDVACAHETVLQPVFIEFNDWLLDYNRTEMERIFGPL